MAAGGAGWFASKYFASNYWADEYWGEPTEVGGYWLPSYWATNYWATNYWATSSREIGDVYVTDDGTLTLAKFVTAVTSGPAVFAPTGALTLNAFDPDAVYGQNIPVTLAGLSLSPLSLDIDGSGYVLGDIWVTLSPESTITVTWNLLPGTPSGTMTAFAPSTFTNNGTSVGVGDIAHLAMTGNNVIANNNVNVQPIPASLSLTGYDSPAAGIGWLINTGGLIEHLYANHTIIAGVPVANVRIPEVAHRYLDGKLHFVFGRPELSLPPPTFNGDYSILNPNADEYPSQYEICDRSGFRVRRNGLVEEWTGAMVREKSWERRNIQDFVRGVGDDQEGSKRPEQTDRYVYEDYPSGVTADDL